MKAGALTKVSDSNKESIQDWIGRDAVDGLFSLLQERTVVKDGIEYECELCLRVSDKPSGFSMVGYFNKAIPHQWIRMVSDRDITKAVKRFVLLNKDQDD